MPSRVLLVTHGHTGLNSPGDIVQSWMDDPLDAKGRAEAKEIAADLKDEGISLLLTSDLRRARETAAMIGREIGCRPQPSRAWRPLKMGVFQGRRSADVREQIDAYLKTPTRAIPGGESLNAFRARLLPALEKVLTEARRREMTVAIVTHSRCVSLVLDWLEAKGNRAAMRAKNMLADVVNPAAVFEIRPRGDFWRGRWVDKGK